MSPDASVIDAEPRPARTASGLPLARFPHQLSRPCVATSSWWTSWCPLARRRGLCAPLSTGGYRRLAKSFATAKLRRADAEAGEGSGL